MNAIRPTTLVCVVSTAILWMGIAGCTLPPRDLTAGTPPRVYPQWEAQPTPPTYLSGARIPAAPATSQRTQLASLQQELAHRDEEERRLRARLDEVEHLTRQLQTELATTRAGQSPDPSGRLAGLEEQLKQLERQIRRVDEQRISDKDEIVDRLSALITAEVNRSRPASSSAPRRSGGRAPTSSPPPTSEYVYEHSVKAGETLSAIAAAYGVTSQEIMHQSNLKDPNLLRPGQVLQIPARE